MQIGFIGLGTMGASMAANLQKAGYRLVVHDVRREAAAPHEAAGAVWASFQWFDPGDRRRLDDFADRYCPYWRTVHHL